VLITALLTVFIGIGNTGGMQRSATATFEVAGK